MNCEIDYIYRDCATKEELECYLKKWTQIRYTAYPILYLASHGEEFISICVGKYNCDLDHIAGILKGKCQNRMVVFGSCSTLKYRPTQSETFFAGNGCTSDIWI